MSTRRRLRGTRAGEVPGLNGLWRRWTIPAIGALTPVGLIVVNIAAFIVHHLSSFQWIITVLAFVSGMMLNSWAGLNIFRSLRRRFPDHPLFGAHNEEFVLVAGMLVVTVLSFITALFCYRGLSNEQDLPNQATFITGTAAILIPVLLQALFRRELGGPTRGQRAPTAYSGTYPPARPSGPPNGPYPPEPAPRDRRELMREGRR